MLSVVDSWSVGVFDRGNGPGLVLIRPVAIGTFVVVDDEVGLVVGGFITSGWIQVGLGFVAGGRVVTSGCRHDGLGVISAGPFFPFVRIHGGADLVVVGGFVTFVFGQAVGGRLVILVCIHGGFGLAVRLVPLVDCHSGIITCGALVLPSPNPGSRGGEGGRGRGTGSRLGFSLQRRHPT